MSTTLTVADLSSAALWLAQNDTDDLDGWFYLGGWLEGDWIEFEEWVRCYGDLARELSGNIKRMVEHDADRMVAAEMRKGAAQ